MEPIGADGMDPSAPSHYMIGYGGEMSVKPVVLMYNLDDEKKARIASICALFGLEARDVEKRFYTTPIGALCQDTMPEMVGAGLVDFDDQMLVMANIQGQRLSLFLDALKTANVRVALKAIVTETNALWDAPTLLQELKREHEALANKSAARVDAAGGDETV